MIGLNFPADGRLNPAFGALLGARWLRVVLKPDVDLTGWIQDAHSRGQKVLGVIARESLTGSYDDTAEFYSYLDPWLDAIQVGNESDHESPSSWTMMPADLNDLLAAFNRFQQPIVGPGMVSGNPHYLDAVDLDLVDAIAVHPYGQRPNEFEDWSELPGNFGGVAGLLDSYRYHGKPIWVTEVGVTTNECSEAFQARYVEAMLKALKLRTDVPVVTWFCADDEMVDGFGLYRNNHPKPAAIAYMKVAGPLEDPMADFQLGFAEMHNAAPDIIGDALEDEWGATPGISQQRTSNGILTWANLVEGGAMTFLSNDGTRYLWDGSALQEVAA